MRKFSTELLGARNRPASCPGGEPWRALVGEPAVLGEQRGVLAAQPGLGKGGAVIRSCRREVPLCFVLLYRELLCGVKMSAS